MTLSEAVINSIDVFTQNSIRIRSAKTIYIDPYQMKEDPHDADLIFITHSHYDHFSADDIKKVSGSSTTLIIPEKMADTAQKAALPVKETVTVKQTDSFTVSGIRAETIPAYNILKPFHPKSAGWVGYIIHIDSCRIYIAGDTDATAEAKKVQCEIALVPIGGTFTMDAKAAAKLIDIIAPGYAIPTHYGSIVGKPSDGDVFAQNIIGSTQVVNKISF